MRFVGGGRLAFFAYPRKVVETYGELQARLGCLQSVQRISFRKLMSGVAHLVGTRPYQPDDWDGCHEYHPATINKLDGCSEKCVFVHNPTIQAWDRRGWVVVALCAGCLSS